MTKKVALVTGSSSGFGLETVLLLAKEGYHVIATMRNMKKNGQLLALAEQSGVTHRITLYPLDVTDHDSLEQLRIFLKKENLPLHVLVNNAGYCAGGITEETDIKEWRMQFETNLFGMVSVTQICLPLLRKTRGTIINIGSISGRLGFPGMAPYAASKFAVAGFSESLSLELAPLSIRVSLVEPGAFQTNIWKKGLEAIKPLEHSPYSRILRNLHREATRSFAGGGHPSEVAKTVLRICKSKKPRLRYPVGRGMKIFTLLKMLLPWSWLQWFVVRILTKKEG